MIVSQPGMGGQHSPDYPPQNSKLTDSPPLPLLGIW
jgi:hypothetical protein